MHRRYNVPLAELTVWGILAPDDSVDVYELWPRTRLALAKSRKPRLSYLCTPIGVTPIPFFWNNVSGGLGGVLVRLGISSNIRCINEYTTWEEVEATWVLFSLSQ